MFNFFILAFSGYAVLMTISNKGEKSKYSNYPTRIRIKT